MEVLKEITEAVEKQDINKLREIVSRLSVSDDSHDLWLSKRVQLAAAILEVEQVGRALLKESNNALSIYADGKVRDHLEDAYNACADLTAWLYPVERTILTRWFDNVQK